MTVKSFIFATASESLLAELAAESEYWKSAQKFIEDFGDLPIDFMSVGKIKWLSKIKTDLIHEARKR